jgi:hypothetical protein
MLKHSQYKRDGAGQSIYKISMVDVGVGGCGGHLFQEIQLEICILHKTSLSLPSLTILIHRFAALVLDCDRRCGAA